MRSCEILTNARVERIAGKITGTGAYGIVIDDVALGSDTAGTGTGIYALLIAAGHC